MVRVVTVRSEADAGLSLGGTEVHVWAADLEAGLEHEARALLSAEERARADRFHFAHDRRHFAVARARLRSLLGLYLGADPRALIFSYGANGKPSLSGSRLRFNASHSGGRALFAFTKDREVGIDIERERDLEDPLTLAGRFFAPAEAQVLRGLSRDEVVPAFFRCWTRKEAYIKATGRGLAEPLDGFEVSFAPGEAARLLRVDGRPGDGQAYRLLDLCPGPGFAAAVAVEGSLGLVTCFRTEMHRSGREGTGRGGIVPVRAEKFQEDSDGAGRAGRQDPLQSGREPRGAVLHMAPRAGKPLGVA
jgi:4'-phosphopantetheinyl transferase